LIGIGYRPSPEVPDKWPVTGLWKLLLCSLQFAFDADPTSAKALKRGNTFTALGSAAHKLEESVHHGKFDDIPEDQLESAVTQHWDVLITYELERLKAQWPEYEAPRVRDLPNYAKVFCNSTERACELVRSRQTSGKSGARVEIERPFEDSETRIEGRPDRIVIHGDTFTVVDIKSGSAGGPIRPSHRHQLLTYCFLIAKETGLSPDSISIQDIEGNHVWESVKSTDVKDHIDLVVAKQGEFLEKTRLNTDWLREATPSSDACQYCNYRVICESYWKQSSDEIQPHDVLGKVVAVHPQGSFTVQLSSSDADQPNLVTVVGYRGNVEPGGLVAVAGGFRHENVLRAGIGTAISFSKSSVD